MTFQDSPNTLFIQRVGTPDSPRPQGPNPQRRRETNAKEESVGPPLPSPRLSSEKP